MIKCIECKKEKEKDCFHRNKNYITSRKNKCKECYSVYGRIYSKKYYNKNKKKWITWNELKRKEVVKKLGTVKDNFLKNKKCKSCKKKDFKLVPRSFSSDRYIPKVSYWTKEKYKKALENSYVMCMSCIQKERWRNHKKSNTKSISNIKC